MGYQAHFLYVLIHEMRHGVESIHNHTQLQSFYNNTGEDKDNLAQYICRSVQHFPARTPFV